MKKIFKKSKAKPNLLVVSLYKRIDSKRFSDVFNTYRDDIEKLKKDYANGNISHEEYLAQAHKFIDMTLEKVDEYFKSNPRYK